jgi:hypothetical protein
MAGDGGEEVESVSLRMSYVRRAVFVCTTISSPGFGGYFKYQIPGICAINYLAPIDIFSYGIFGILKLIIQHLFQLSCMHIYYWH